MLKWPSKRETSTDSCNIWNIEKGFHNIRQLKIKLKPDYLVFGSGSFPIQNGEILVWTAQCHEKSHQHPVDFRWSGDPCFHILRTHVFISAGWMPTDISSMKKNCDYGSPVTMVIPPDSLRMLFVPVNFIASYFSTWTFSYWQMSSS